MSSRKRLAIGPLFTGLVADAAAVAPCGVPLATALDDHREHRRAWYAPLVGPLLLPASALDELAGLLRPDERLRVGVVADAGIDAARHAVRRLPGTVALSRIDAPTTDDDAVAALARLTDETGVPGFARLPVDGLPPRLARLAEAGLTPTPLTDRDQDPAALARALVECAAAGVDVELALGPQRLLRRVDPATGTARHGFGNVLAAAALAAAGGNVEQVARLLEITETDPVRYSIRGMLASPRRLLSGFGSCRIAEPLDDLVEWSLVTEES